jgi:putative endonuclease
MRKGYVYILASRPGGAIYVGVTSDPIRRIAEHRASVTRGFTSRYHIERLVYFEVHDSVATAIQREKNIKHWPRAWKVNLINAENPSWSDLYQTLI